MKTALPILALTLFTACAAHAAPLAVFDFENPAARNAPVVFSPSLVTVSDLYAPELTQSFYSSGGVGNSAYTSYAGWDQHQFDPAVYGQRDALYQFPYTAAFEVTVNDGHAIANPSLSLNYQRSSSGSPDYLQASIFWKDTAGIIQNWSTGPVNLIGAGTWNGLNFNFVNGTVAFPAPGETNGETFLIELYAWGGDTCVDGVLKLDNITVNGDCAPIPEPGSAILFAAAGFAILLRRRNRR